MYRDGDLPTHEWSHVFLGRSELASLSRFASKRSDSMGGYENGEEKGLRIYDMGGGGDYKRKYGGFEIEVPWFRKSKYPWLRYMRELAEHSHRLRQQCFGGCTLHFQPSGGVLGLRFAVTSCVEIRISGVSSSVIPVPIFRRFSLISILHYSSRLTIGQEHPDYPFLI